MTIPVYIPYIFLALSLLGGYSAYLYGRKTKKFKWSEYFALISVPVICVLSLSYFYGVRIIYLFLASSFVGFILEYLVGFGYHKTLNKRLWKYDRHNLHGYTSYLTLPMWGVAGIIFWMIAISIGL